jgi:aspartate/methionine/tyrosine aminotransferase
MKSQNAAAESFPVSRNVAEMKMSSTLKAGQMAAELRERGFHVIDLTLGEPDFPTPRLSKNTPGKVCRKIDEIYADRRAENF